MSIAQPPEPALRLAFYGDDFTGATDALEVLAFAGLRTALFLAVPSPETLRELGPFDAIGVAGDSRAMTPEEMVERLAPVLRDLAALATPWVHYKVCSTFDSSPLVGSIGQVMVLARQAFGAAAIPIIAGTPALGRYCAFANLFARAGSDGEVHRLDRHPTMSRHPLTPMGEGDLVRHLAAQTALPIASLSLPHLDAGAEATDRELDRLIASGAAAVLFDATTAQHLSAAGRSLERLAAGQARPRFAIGSSGFEYALTQWWRETGRLPAAPPRNERGDRGARGDRVERVERVDLVEPGHRVEPVDRVLAVSGSASPLSALQIDAALAAGFVDVPVDARALVAESGWEAACAALVAATCQALRAGQSVMLHSARGPHDPRIAALLAALVAGGRSHEQARHEGGRWLGQRLGRVVAAVLQQVALRRLVVSGGDTASQITQVLAPQALQVEARLAPGAPLCRLIAQPAHLNGLQIALKGGQMGSPDYFVEALRGRGA